MNTDLTTPESSFEPQGVPPTTMRATRPMYWSIHRELWENRSIYLAPLIVAAVVLFASALSTMYSATRVRTVPTASGMRVASMAKHLKMAPAPIMFTTLLVGLFYCLDALHGERRDRSILFWKSLPVSDRTTVLSKASIPLVVLPLIAFALSVVAQIILLQVGSMALLGRGMRPAALWTEARFFEGLLIMIYGLTVHVLWFAPIYGWLLLISAWARRAPFLWVVLPPLAISAVERITSNTWSFMRMLQYRVAGAMTEAFDFKGMKSGDADIDRLSQLTPGRFLSAPGLWVGLIFAAACLVAAVRLRRNREPI
jgi:ABC-2 type transport system permease protein